MNKFRSWNEQGKNFTYFINGNYFFDVECLNDDNIFLSNLFKWRNAEQATGLLDKNNKEIFEGDMLSDRKGKSVVTYFKNTGQFLILKKNGTGYYFNDGDIARPCQLQYIKVIGNIHGAKDVRGKSSSI